MSADGFAPMAADPAALAALITGVQMPDQELVNAIKQCADAGAMAAKDDAEKAERLANAAQGFAMAYRTLHPPPKASPGPARGSSESAPT